MDGPVLVTYDVFIWFKEQSFPSKKQAFIDQVQPLSCRSYRRGSGFLTAPETWHIICLHHLSSKSIINNDTDLQWLNKPSDIRYRKHLIQHFFRAAYLKSVGIRGLWCHSWHVCSSVLSDIQEFYEVTLLDSQRWVESSKAADPMAPVHLWDFSSLQSTTVTSDTLPSLSTSIEVRPDGSHGTGSELLLLVSELLCPLWRWWQEQNSKNREH